MACQVVNTDEMRLVAVQHQSQGQRERHMEGIHPGSFSSLARERGDRDHTHVATRSGRFCQE